MPLPGEVILIREKMAFARHIGGESDSSLGHEGSTNS
jgi:hypothetical protein